MPVLTRADYKQYFEHIMRVLDLQPEDKAHKLFMVLTRKGQRSFATILNVDKSDPSSLQSLEATDADGNKLSLDEWEVNEVVNVSRYAVHQRTEKGENFRLKDIDIASYQDFILSPACTQVQCSRGDITKTLHQA